jgi:lysine-N-methylase
MLRMKIITPYYYKNFKCIAGDCEDTCCAGWDVDVDDKSYKFYKTVKGDFGKRLKSVMVPEKDGGCTFTLTSDKRCPFLNSANLCDLYVALGEEHLCETCDEFPRFINEYGSVREIGIAPSCITAGQLMFSGREKMHFEEREDGKPLNSYNDIDAFLYLQLKNARTLAFDIIDHQEFSTDEVCVILLEYARQIQKRMDDERDDLIANVVKKFKDIGYCRGIVEKRRLRLWTAKGVNEKFTKSDTQSEDFNNANVSKSDMQDEDFENANVKNSGAQSDNDFSNITTKKYIKVMAHFFDDFKGMEVINPDWLAYVSRERKFENEILNSNSDIKSNLKVKSNSNEKSILNSDMKSNSNLKAKLNSEHDFRFRQLLDYYVFRYFLDSVYDINLMLKIKNAVVGYLIVRQLCFVCFCEKGSVTFDEFVDIAHLYSRQFEHSYVNFEVYSEYFMTKRCYSVNALEGLMLL